MKIKIVRVDKSLPLPKYETLGAVGFDIICRLETTVKPKQIGLIPSNLIIKTPKGYALILVPRSSMPGKKGLSFPHSIGVIDQDYSGDKDEILIQVYNFSSKKTVIKRGEKIAQGMFFKIEKPIWKEVKSHGVKSRGGFGSTDRN